MKKTIIALFCLFLAACGSKLSGTYTDALGITSYKFEPGGKVYVSAMGIETEWKYEVDGKKVKIEGAQGNIVLTMMDDGSLQGPLDIKLTKKQ